MSEERRCPNCGAVLPETRPGAGLKCEYCRTVIVAPAPVNQPVSPVRPPQQQYVPPSHNAAPVHQFGANPGNKKKWTSALCWTLAIEAVAVFLLCVMAACHVEKAATLLIIGIFMYTLAVPAYLAGQKPTEKRYTKGARTATWMLLGLLYIVDAVVSFVISVIAVAALSGIGD